MLQLVPSYRDQAGRNCSLSKVFKDYVYCINTSLSFKCDGSFDFSNCMDNTPASNHAITSLTSPGTRNKSIPFTDDRRARSWGCILVCFRIYLLLSLLLLSILTFRGFSLLTSPSPAALSCSSLCFRLSISCLLAVLFCSSC